MNAPSLHNKTVRPGSLNGYTSYYHADRSKQQSQPSIPKKSHKKRLLLVVMLLLLAVPITNYLQKDDNGSASTLTATTKKTPAVTASAPTPVNQCVGNTEAKLIKIDISDRRLWACDAGKRVYDAAVITGMEAHESTLTPTGTYHIYAKQKDTVLTGSDETGSWRDPVSYWMPFLDNKYGTYGFHDATWRSADEFGNIDPNGDKASHGCIELPLAASAWLYNWAQVGTTLTIES